MKRRLADIAPRKAALAVAVGGLALAALVRSNASCPLSEFTKRRGKAKIPSGKEPVTVPLQASV